MLANWYTLLFRRSGYEHPPFPDDYVRSLARTATIRPENRRRSADQESRMLSIGPEDRSIVIERSTEH